MRTVAIIVALVLSGCVHQEAAQPKTITKTTIVEKIVYRCRPEPPAGCNSLRSEAECRQNLRCDWTRRRAGYCHRIFCRGS